MCSSDCFLAVLAVLFPPIAVWVKRGVCSADSIINIALLCLGYLPGLLHAWYIIAKYPDPYSYSYEPIEGGNQRVYYYTATYPSVAAHTQPSYAPQQQGCHHHHQQGHRPQSPRSQTRPHTYGTTATATTTTTAAASVSSPPRPVTETTVADTHKPAIQPQDNLPVANGMDHGEGSSAGPSQPPPSYSDVVKGDYKIQTA
ncbi:hypothetical protein TWF225_012049 [Orbilia oligospora]|uniref:Uncharacterized protein n=1 Tax=Orbilia oligospora TaxID=2813651 RepID=A0A7C8K4T8_ORBOL|nr:hypothetical protein TWF751_002590 [Orbilia oligospora]KAF3167341.1 hypothetical protein TWF225_012049 [Orbilia oligospora]KAF3232885.1 hypothetical protein TWF128_003507 [Orbilia oligospora]KAF3240035.1 hypothetical protein TWF217_001151 [Orbilia oligospora]KAF3277227.1 hypothetical protein TWF132_001739 [Orbilia oligospora]